MVGARLAALVLGLVGVSVSACSAPLIGPLGRGRDTSAPTSAVPSAPTTVPSVQSCEQPAAGSEFQRVDPSAVALEPGAVRAATEYANDRGAQSIRIYRRHCLVATGRFDGSTGWTPLPSWSMTKGMVALVVGRAVTLGHLGVDDPIGAHLGDSLGRLSPQHAAITVRQLLTQTSGLRFAWANDLNAAATLDSAARVLERPFEAEPGSTYIYAQTTVTALVAVVEAATGEDFQAFAARELFEPIGIGRAEWAWARDGAGRTQGFAFLDMTPRAFGRVGALLLEDGRWRGQQLIDADYIAQARTGTEANPAYGFLWWNNASEWLITAGFPAQQLLERRWLPAAPRDAFGLSGMFDQQMIVIPSLDMVVLRMGQPHELFGDPLGEMYARRPSWDHRFFQMLLDGVTDVDLPETPDWVPDPDVLEPDWKHLVGTGF